MQPCQRIAVNSNISPPFLNPFSLLIHLLYSVIPHIYAVYSLLPSALSVFSVRVLVRDTRVEPPISQTLPAVAMAEANGTDPAGDLIDLFSNVLKDLLKAAQPENKTEGDEEKEASEKAANQEPVVCLSEVKKVDFEHFKNRFHEKNEAYAVEALVASASLAHDVNQEQLKRIGTSLPWMRIIESSEDEIVLPGGGWVQRVRINSQAVLGFLAKAAAEVWALDQPRTFLRPFRVLIYFQDKMKEALNELEQKWANTPGSQAAEDNVDHATVGTAQESPEASKTSNDVPMPSPDENFKAEKKTAVPGQQNVDAFMGSYDTLKEMRCYVNFVDKEIMPLVDMFEATAKKEIRFEELWLLFKTGETIYGPPGERVIRRHIDSHFGKSIIPRACEASITSYPY